MASAQTAWRAFIEPRATASGGVSTAIAGALGSVDGDHQGCSDHEGGDDAADEELPIDVFVRSHR